MHHRNKGMSQHSPILLCSSVPPLSGQKEKSPHHMHANGSMKVSKRKRLAHTSFSHGPFTPFAKHSYPSPSLLIAVLLCAFLHPISPACATGLFPPHSNPALFSPITASATCGPDTPTSYCFLEFQSNAVFTYLQCVSYQTCLNNSCPYGTNLPPSINILASSTISGDVSLERLESRERERD